MEKHAEDDHCQCCHRVCVCSELSLCVFWVVTVCVLVGNEGKGPIPSQGKDTRYLQHNHRKRMQKERKKATIGKTKRNENDKKEQQNTF